MDFASALEDLERTADAAASGRGGSHPRGGGASRGRRRERSEDQYSNHRRNQRPRHNHNSNHHHHYHRGYSSDRGSRGGRHHHHRGPPPPPHAASHHHHHPLEDMERFGYRTKATPVATEKPPPDLGQANRPFHIALLAICIDGLPYEHLWRAWATAANCNTRVSLLVHAKYPHRVTSTFLKQRLLVHPPKLGRGNSYADPEFVSHQPNWGSVQITRAMIDLLRDGLVLGTPKAEMETDARFAKKRYSIPVVANDTNETTLPPVDKFIFISETCVPVASLAEFEQALFGSPELYTVQASDSSTTTPNVNITPWHLSWVNARNRNTPGTPKNKYERDQFSDIFRMVPGQYRWKADQWMALSRLHAASVAAMDAHLHVSDQLWNSFTKISASDEMYFPTALAILQIIQDPKVVMRLKEQQSMSSSGRERGASLDLVEKPKEETDEECQGDGDRTKEKPEESTDDAAGADTAADKNPDPTVESLSPTVLFRPITFTDWSEGMRNPKSFFRGSNDLLMTGRLARQQGSLLARKFILCPPSEDPSGKAPEELSGYISVEEWKQMLEEAGPLAEAKPVSSSGAQAN